MLKLYIERAEIKNGQEVLDLGCGWAVFLYMWQKISKHKHYGNSNSMIKLII